MICLRLKLSHVGLSKAIIVIESFTEALSGILDLCLCTHLHVIPMHNCKFVKFLSIVRPHILAIQLRVILFVFINFFVKVENSDDLSDPEK